MGLLDDYGEHAEIGEDKEISTIRDLAHLDKLDKIIEKFDEWINIPEFLDRSFKRDSESWKNACDSLKDFSILPNEVDQIIPLLDQFSQHRNFSKTGLFLSSMIQNSYGSGHNNFVLNIPEHMQINKISRLYGNEQNTFTFTSQEDRLNYLYGKNQRRMKIIINGDVGDKIGGKSIYCDFVFNGSVGSYAAHQSFLCTYIFNEFVDYQVAFASDTCDFHFKNGLGDLPANQAKMCHFYSPEKDDLLAIIDLNRISYGCKFFQIKDDGSKERIDG